MPDEIIKRPELIEKLIPTVEEKPIETRIVNFRYSVPVATGVTLEDESPLDGQMTQILIHFPPGTLSLVNVAIFKEGSRIIPKEGYLALDDFTPVYDVNELIKKNEKILVEMRNTDDTYAHIITVTITIVGRR